MPSVRAAEAAGNHIDGLIQPVPLATIRAAAPDDENLVIVRQRNKFFDPPVVVIHAGDTVAWVNDTRGGWHDVQSYEGLFSSPKMEWGYTFLHTFEEPGVYGYYCSPHVIDGMQGAVVVLPKESPLPDPLPAPRALSPTSASGGPLQPGAPGVISTVAGSGGVDGQASDASLFLPAGIAFDEARRLYIADTENCQVRRVAEGIIVSILGHESCGASMGGDADLGPWLHTNHPQGVVAGPDEALYVADTVNCRVRKINEGGTVTTIAGNGSCRASGDGGPAKEGGLAPWGLASHGSDLYIADPFNCRVRRVDGNGVIDTVAGNGVCGFSGDGGAATTASLFFPRDMALGPNGDLYIADSENCRVRLVQLDTGRIDTVAGNGSCDFAGDGGPALAAGVHPWALIVGPDGRVLVADRQNCRLRAFIPGGAISTIAGTGTCGFSGDGGPALDAELNWPSDLAFGPDGAVHVADTGSCRIRRIDAAGTIDTVAGSGACAPGGDGGAATAGGAWHPMGLAMASDGTWFFSELDTCRVRRIDANGVVSTYAGTGVCGFSGDGGPATDANLSDLLGGLAVESDNTLYVAEGYNCRVRMIDPDQVIHTIAGTGVCGFSGDGGQAQEAQVDFVSDVALDGRGGLYLAEPFNCRVRRIDLATGIIDTVVGDGSCGYNGEGIRADQAGVDPWGVALGPDGTLYLADSSNCRVRRVGANGRINTVAGGDECGYAGDGGRADQAQLLRPYDLTLDQEGNLYIADLRTFTVRKVDGQGVISTVAGSGISRPVDIGGYDPTNGVLCSIHNLPLPAPIYMGDGGPASQAGLYFPYAIAIGHDSNLYIADTFDHRVRRVTCGGDVPCAGPAEPAGQAAPEGGSGPSSGPGALASGSATVRDLPEAGLHDGNGRPVLAGLLAAAGAAIVLMGSMPPIARLRRRAGQRSGASGHGTSA